MNALKIIGEGEQVVGVLPCVEDEMSLARLREEIREDLDVEGFFFFSVDGSKLDAGEEHSVTVESAADVSGDVRTIKLFVTPEKAPSPVTTGAEQKKPPQQTPPPSTGSAARSLLRSPTSCEVRGVKIYSHEEAEAAKGMEKRRRVFWNTLAKKLCTETKKSKSEICKAIDVAWRKEQATLLLDEEKVLGEAGVRCSRLKPGTIGRNAERVRSSQRELEKIDSEIEAAKTLAGKKRRMEMEHLEAKKKFHLSELKKAQGCMRKNLNIKPSDVKNITKNF